MENTEKILRWDFKKNFRVSKKVLEKFWGKFEVNFGVLKIFSKKFKQNCSKFLGKILKEVEGHSGKTLKKFDKILRKFRQNK